VASVLSATGGWSAVFIAAAVITIAAGVSAKFFLAPMRKRLIEQSSEASNDASNESNVTLATNTGAGLPHWSNQSGE
jgi:OFA family oxalate/formate antiporter-like MFS transporter